MVQGNNHKGSRPFRELALVVKVSDRFQLVDATVRGQDVGLFIRLGSIGYCCSNGSGCPQ